MRKKNRHNIRQGLSMMDLNVKEFIDIVVHIKRAWHKKYFQKCKCDEDDKNCSCKTYFTRVSRSTIRIRHKLLLHVVEQGYRWQEIYVNNMNFAKISKLKTAYTETIRFIQLGYLKLHLLGPVACLVIDLLSM